MPETRIENIAPGLMQGSRAVSRLTGEANQLPAQLVCGEKLLEVLFEESSRPTLRWLRERQKDRSIPFVRLGNLVMFDPQVVRESLAARAVRPL
jgi:hypothetical protein